MTPQEIKAECEARWNRPDMIHSDNINAFEAREGDKSMNIFAGRRSPDHWSKEARKWRSQFAMFNAKLAPSILAQAEKSIGTVRRNFEKKGELLPHYVFGKQTECDEAPAPVAKAPKATKPAKAPAKTAKRVTKRRIDAAVAILAKIDRAELPAFFARFGVKLEVAQEIAANDNLPEIARKFLKLALAA